MKIENDVGPESIIFIFVDGIGIGRKDLENNPFTRYARDFFSVLGGKDSFTPPGKLIPTDAHMGLTGALPQSGTGQVALFTGHNTAAIMGRHVAGFPPFSLRPLIKNESIVKNFLQHQLKASVINTYTQKYLDLLTTPRTERFMSASTLMQVGSGQRLLTIEDLMLGRSIFMDITNWFLRSELGYDIPEITPRDAGRRVVSISRDYNLIVFEYFFPDKYGHDGHLHNNELVVYHLEEFLSGIWEDLDPSNSLIILSSDHGNFEDLSVPVHTHNPVPTIVYGKGDNLAEQYIRNIYDVPRFLMSLKNIPYIEYKKQN